MLGKEKVPKKREILSSQAELYPLFKFLIFFFLFAFNQKAEEK
jgi:hypothetical protein